MFKKGRQCPLVIYDYALKARIIFIVLVNLVLVCFVLFNFYRSQIFIESYKILQG